MFTVISDSSCDLKTADLASEKINFITVPIRLESAIKAFTDDDSLDTAELTAFMKANKTALKTACPPPEAFEEIMRGADGIICATLSSKISGTYNSARLAMENVLKEFPGKKIFVLDSLLASAGLALILLKLKTLIENGAYADFEGLTKSIAEYRSAVKIRFVLQDFSNMVKTGRMSKIAGIIGSVLTIKLICGDNGNGEIKMCQKTLGMRKALTALANCPAEKAQALGAGIPIVISHCDNKPEADYLEYLLRTKYNLTNIKICKMRGTASFYANDKGLAIAY